MNSKFIVSLKHFLKVPCCRLRPLRWSLGFAWLNQAEAKDLWIGDLGLLQVLLLMSKSLELQFLPLGNGNNNTAQATARVHRKVMGRQVRQRCPNYKVHLALKVRWQRCSALCRDSHHPSHLESSPTPLCLPKSSPSSRSPPSRAFHPTLNVILPS